MNRAQDFALSQEIPWPDDTDATNHYVFTSMRSNGLHKKSLCGRFA